MLSGISDLAPCAMLSSSATPSATTLQPRGIAVDPNGNFYFADSLSNRV